ncbi:MAG: PilZ domain-containing protein [Planctomycetota bacterium]|jgi:c-di-GMP-binding flagellar brake protein YcgR|nr:PilZ domain-containing protein [Planctomycetota bacterium]
MFEPVSDDLSTLEDAFSPVEAAAAGLPQSREERRIAARVDFDAHARYRFPSLPAARAWMHGVVVNLSETGGCFLVDGGWDLLSRLEGDEWVPLDVELHPEGQQPIRLRAEIAWVQPDQGGDGGLDRVGARFDAVNPAERERLQCFLAAERRRTFGGDEAKSA